MKFASKLLSIALIFGLAAACQDANRPQRPSLKRSANTEKGRDIPKNPTQSGVNSNPETSGPDQEGGVQGMPKPMSNPIENPNPDPNPNSNPNSTSDPKPDPVSGPKPDPMPDPTPTTPKVPKLSLLFTGNNQGQIAVYKFDRAAGTATLLKSNNFSGKAPTFLAFDVKNKRVFSVNEVSDGGLVSYSFDPASGTLNLLSSVSFPSGATHVGLDPSAKFIFGASYNGHKVYSFPIGNDGKIGAQISAEGSGMNSHQAAATANAVFVPALGSNQIAMYSMANGQLTSQGTLPLSGGPRHMAIHPNGKWAYALTENSQQVLAMDVNGAKLIAKGAPISALISPAGGYGAEIQVHPNGKFVYASLRGNNHIASFAVNADGTVKLLKNVKTGGDWPRHFSLDSTGEWMFVGNEKGGGVTIFKVDLATGDLAKQAATVPAQGPQFVELVDFD